MYNFIDKLYNFSTFSFSTKIKQFWGKNDEKWEFANFIDLSFEKKKKRECLDFRSSWDGRNVFWRSSAKRREPASAKVLWDLLYDPCAAAG